MAVLSYRDPPVAREGRRGEPLTAKHSWAGVTAFSGDDLFPTRALAKFVKALGDTPAPVVIDLGQAVGVNVSFLGEQLGCKLHVEDLLSDLDMWGPPRPVENSTGGGGDADSGGRDTIAGPREFALKRANESVDGVLCWDVIDYLEADAAAGLGAEVERVLKPGGVVFVCHAAEQCQIAGPIQHEIVDEVTLRYRTSERAAPPSHVRQSRAITQMFAGLTVIESFLLTNRMREVVFRKPPASTTEG